jgi:hypothetical protein
VVVRRRLTALAAVGAVAVAVGAAIVASGDGKSAAPSAGSGGTPRAETPLTELPGGGRRLFPDRRVVAFYGNPRDPELGALGIGTPSQAARRLARQARAYNRKTRPVLPAMELIATTATAAPGPKGHYSDHLSFTTIGRYLRAARRAKALLVLDIQPGRAQFGPEIERLARWLREPDVGLALDPEWHVGPGEVPGKVIGSMDADAVNAASAYLSKIVQENGLPEKLLLVHRFTDDMIARDERLREAPGVRTVINVDGFGGREVKIAKYHNFVRRTRHLRRGFKLFYKEDANLLRPAQVMRMNPRPDVIVYE